MPHGLFRRFAFLAHLIVLVACAASGERAGAEERPPITGKAVPRLKQLDQKESKRVSGTLFGGKKFLTPFRTFILYVHDKITKSAVFVSAM